MIQNCKLFRNFAKSLHTLALLIAVGLPFAISAKVDNIPHLYQSNNTIPNTNPNFINPINPNTATNPADTLKPNLTNPADTYQVAAIYNPTSTNPNADTYQVAAIYNPTPTINPTAAYHVAAIYNPTPTNPNAATNPNPTNPNAAINPNPYINPNYDSFPATWERYSPYSPDNYLPIRVAQVSEDNISSIINSTRYEYSTLRPYSPNYNPDNVDEINIFVDNDDSAFDGGGGASWVITRSVHTPTTGATAATVTINLAKADRQTQGGDELVLTLSNSIFIENQPMVYTYDIQGAVTIQSFTGNFTVVHTLAVIDFSDSQTEVAVSGQDDFVLTVGSELYFNYSDNNGIPAQSQVTSGLSHFIYFGSALTNVADAALSSGSTAPALACEFQRNSGGSVVPASFGSKVALPEYDIGSSSLPVSHTTPAIYTVTAEDIRALDGNESICISHDTNDADGTAILGWQDGLGDTPLVGTNYPIVVSVNAVSLSISGVFAHGGVLTAGVINLPNADYLWERSYDGGATFISLAVGKTYQVDRLDFINAFRPAQVRVRATSGDRVRESITVYTVAGDGEVSGNVEIGRRGVGGSVDALVRGDVVVANVSGLDAPTSIRGYTYRWLRDIPDSSPLSFEDITESSPNNARYTVAVEDETGAAMGLDPLLKLEVTPIFDFGVAAEVFAATVTITSDSPVLDVEWSFDGGLTDSSQISIVSVRTNLVMDTFRIGLRRFATSITGDETVTHTNLAAGTTSGDILEIALNISDIRHDIIPGLRIRHELFVAASRAGVAGEYNSSVVTLERPGRVSLLVGEQGNLAVFEGRLLRAVLEDLNGVAAVEQNTDFYIGLTNPNDCTSGGIKRQITWTPTEASLRAESPNTTTEGGADNYRITKEDMELLAINPYICVSPRYDNSANSDSAGDTGSADAAGFPDTFNDDQARGLYDKNAEIVGIVSISIASATIQGEFRPTPGFARNFTIRRNDGGSSSETYWLYAFPSRSDFARQRGDSHFNYRSFEIVNITSALGHPPYEPVTLGAEFDMETLPYAPFASLSLTITRVYVPTLQITGDLAIGGVGGDGIAAVGDILTADTSGLVSQTGGSLDNNYYRWFRRVSDSFVPIPITSIVGTVTTSSFATDSTYTVTAEDIASGTPQVQLLLSPIDPLGGGVLTAAVDIEQSDTVFEGYFSYDSLIIGGSTTTPVYQGEFSRIDVIITNTLNADTDTSSFITSYRWVIRHPSGGGMSYTVTVNTGSLPQLQLRGEAGRGYGKDGSTAGAFHYNSNEAESIELKIVRKYNGGARLGQRITFFVNATPIQVQQPGKMEIFVAGRDNDSGVTNGSVLDIRLTDINGFSSSSHTNLTQTISFSANAECLSQDNDIVVNLTQPDTLRGTVAVLESAVALTPLQVSLLMRGNNVVCAKGNGFYDSLETERDSAAASYNGIVGVAPTRVTTTATDVDFRGLLELDGDSVTLVGRGFDIDQNSAAITYNDGQLNPLCCAPARSGSGSGVRWTADIPGLPGGFTRANYPLPEPLRIEAIVPLVDLPARGIAVNITAVYNYVLPPAQGVIRIVSDTAITVGSVLSVQLDFNNLGRQPSFINNWQRAVGVTSFGNISGEEGATYTVLAGDGQIRFSARYFGIYGGVQDFLSEPVVIQTDKFSIAVVSMSALRLGFGEIQNDGTGSNTDKYGFHNTLQIELGEFTPPLPTGVSIITYEWEIRSGGNVSRAGKRNATGSNIASLPLFGEAGGWKTHAEVRDNGGFLFGGNVYNEIMLIATASNGAVGRIAPIINPHRASGGITYDLLARNFVGGGINTFPSEVTLRAWDSGAVSGLDTNLRFVISDPNGLGGIAPLGVANMLRTEIYVGLQGADADCTSGTKRETGIWGSTTSNGLDSAIPSSSGENAVYAVTQEDVDILALHPYVCVRVVDAETGEVGVRDTFSRFNEPGNSANLERRYTLPQALPTDNYLRFELINGSRRVEIGATVRLTYGNWKTRNKQPNGKPSRIFFGVGWGGAIKTTEIPVRTPYDFVLSLGIFTTLTNSPGRIRVEASADGPIFSGNIGRAIFIEAENRVFPEAQGFGQVVVERESDTGRGRYIFRPTLPNDPVYNGNNPLLVPSAPRVQYAFPGNNLVGFDHYWTYDGIESFEPILDINDYLATVGGGPIAVQYRRLLQSTPLFSRNSDRLFREPGPFQVQLPVAVRSSFEHGSIATAFIDSEVLQAPITYTWQGSRDGFNSNIINLPSTSDTYTMDVFAFRPFAGEAAIRVHVTDANGSRAEITLAAGRDILPPLEVEIYELPDVLGGYSVRISPQSPHFAYESPIVNLEVNRYDLRHATQNYIIDLDTAADKLKIDDNILNSAERPQVFAEVRYRLETDELRFSAPSPTLQFRYVEAAIGGDFQQGGQLRAGLSEPPISQPIDTASADNYIWEGRRGGEYVILTVGASARSYTVNGADFPFGTAAAQIRLAIQEYDDDGELRTITRTVRGYAPTGSEAVVVVITGAFTQGAEQQVNLLRGSLGAVESLTAADYTYEWERSIDGGTAYETIANVTTNIYTFNQGDFFGLVDGEVGYVRAILTPTSGGGAAITSLPHSGIPSVRLFTANFSQAGEGGLTAERGLILASGGTAKGAFSTLTIIDVTTFIAKGTTVSGYFWDIISGGEVTRISTTEPALPLTGDSVVNAFKMLGNETEEAIQIYAVVDNGDVLEGPRLDEINLPGSVGLSNNSSRVTVGGLLGVLFSDPNGISKSELRAEAYLGLSDAEDCTSGERKDLTSVVPGSASNVFDSIDNSTGLAGDINNPRTRNAAVHLYQYTAEDVALLSERSLICLRLIDNASGEVGFRDSFSANTANPTNNRGNAETIFTAPLVPGVRFDFDGRLTIGSIVTMYGIGGLVASEFNSLFGSYNNNFDTLADAVNNLFLGSIPIAFLSVPNLPTVVIRIIPAIFPSITTRRGISINILAVPSGVITHSDGSITRLEGSTNDPSRIRYFLRSTTNIFPLPNVSIVPQGNNRTYVATIDDPTFPEGDVISYAWQVVPSPAASLSINLSLKTLDLSALPTTGTEPRIRVIVEHYDEASNTITINVPIFQTPAVAAVQLNGVIAEQGVVTAIVQNFPPGASIAYVWQASRESVDGSITVSYEILASTFNGRYTISAFDFPAISENSEGIQLLRVEAVDLNDRSFVSRSNTLRGTSFILPLPQFSLAQDPSNFRRWLLDIPPDSPYRTAPGNTLIDFGVPEGAFINAEGTTITLLNADYPGFIAENRAIPVSYSRPSILNFGASEHGLFADRNAVVVVANVPYATQDSITLPTLQLSLTLRLVETSIGGDFQEGGTLTLLTDPAGTASGEYIWQGRKNLLGGFVLLTVTDTPSYVVNSDDFPAGEDPAQIQFIYAETANGIRQIVSRTNVRTYSEIAADTRVGVAGELEAGTRLEAIISRGGLGAEISGGGDYQYQWQRSINGGDTFQDIPDINSDFYIVNITHFVGLSEGELAQVRIRANLVGVLPIFSAPVIYTPKSFAGLTLSVTYDYSNFEGSTFPQVYIGNTIVAAVSGDSVAQLLPGEVSYIWNRARRFPVGSVYGEQANIGNDAAIVITPELAAYANASERYTAIRAQAMVGSPLGGDRVIINATNSGDIGEDDYILLHRPSPSGDAQDGFTEFLQHHTNPSLLELAFYDRNGLHTTDLEVNFLRGDVTLSTRTWRRGDLTPNRVINNSILQYAITNADRDYARRGFNVITPQVIATTDENTSPAAPATPPAEGWFDGLGRFVRTDNAGLAFTISVETLPLTVGITVQNNALVAFADVGENVNAEIYNILTYQWQRGGGTVYTNIFNATNPTYLPPAQFNDAFPSVRLSVSYTDTISGDTRQTISPPFSAFGVRNAAIPAITGPAIGRVGNSYSATVGDFLDVFGRPASSSLFTYQWQISDNSGLYNNIATGSSYVLQADDVPFVGVANLRVVAQSRGGLGLQARFTSDTAAVGSTLQIAILGEPILAGTVTTQLSADGGAIDAEDSRLSYQWQRRPNESRIWTDVTEATLSSYEVGEDPYLDGVFPGEAQLQVVVTYTDESGFINNYQAFVDVLQPTIRVIDCCRDFTMSLDISPAQVSLISGFNRASKLRYYGINAAGERVNVRSASILSANVLGIRNDFGDYQVYAAEYIGSSGEPSFYSPNTPSINRPTRGEPIIELDGGVFEEGATLSVYLGGLTDENGVGRAYSYVWSDTAGNIVANNTVATYILQEAEVTLYENGETTLQVVVTHTDLLAFVQTLPTVSYEPVGLNVQLIGATLVAELRRGTSTGTYNLQWVQGAEDAPIASYTNIVGANNSVYVVPLNRDVATPFLRLRVGYTNEATGTQGTVYSRAVRVAGIDADNSEGVSIIATGPGNGRREGDVLRADISSLRDITGRQLGANNLLIDVVRYAPDGTAAETIRVNGVSYTIPSGFTGVDQIAFRVRHRAGGEQITTPRRQIQFASAGAVAIQGSAGNFNIGNVLTADISAITDDNGINAFQYDWRRLNVAGDSFNSVGSSNEPEYTLREADFQNERAAMRVVVRHIDGLDFRDATFTSAPQLLNNPPVAVNVAALGGEVVGVNVSRSQTIDSYQWRAGDSTSLAVINNQISPTYNVPSSYNVSLTHVQAEVTYKLYQADGTFINASATAPPFRVVGVSNPSAAVQLSLVGGFSLSPRIDVLRDPLGRVVRSDLLRYQWQVGREDGTDYADVVGENNAFFNFEESDIDIAAGRTFARVQMTDQSRLALAPFNSQAHNLAALFGRRSISGEFIHGETLILDVDGLPLGIGLQWQRSLDGGTAFADISGENGSTYFVNVGDFSGASDEIPAVVRVSLSGELQAQEDISQSRTFISAPLFTDNFTGTLSYDSLIVNGAPLTIVISAEKAFSRIRSVEWEIANNSNILQTVTTNTAGTQSSEFHLLPSYFTGDAAADYALQAVLVADGRMGGLYTLTLAAAAATLSQDGRVSVLTNSPRNEVIVGSYIRMNLHDINGVGSGSYTIRANIGGTALGDVTLNYFPPEAIRTEATVVTAFEYILKAEDITNLASNERVQVVLGVGDRGFADSLGNYNNGTAEFNVTPVTPLSVTAFIADGALTARFDRDGVVVDEDTATYEWQEGGADFFNPVSAATLATYAPPTTYETDYGPSVRVQATYNYGGVIITTILSEPIRVVGVAESAAFDITPLDAGSLIAGRTIVVTGALDPLGRPVPAGVLNYQWIRVNSEGVRGDSLPAADTAASYVLGAGFDNAVPYLQLSATDKSELTTVTLTSSPLLLNSPAGGQVEIEYTGGEGLNTTLSLNNQIRDDNEGAELAVQWFADNGNTAVGSPQGTFGGELVLNAFGVEELGAGRAINVSVIHTDGLGFETDFTAAYRRLDVLVSLTANGAQAFVNDVNTVAIAASFTYQWQQNATASGNGYTDIADATNVFYRATGGHDITQPFVRAVVSYTLVADTVSATVPTSGLRVIGVTGGSVTIGGSGGSNKEGTEREAITDGITDLFGRAAPADYLTYQWQVSGSENSGYVAISATTRIYALSSADFSENDARYLRVSVGSAIVNDSYGGVLSASEDVQRPIGGNIEINTSGGFEAGDSLSVDNNLTGDNSGAAVALSDIVWESINGGTTTQIETGETYTIDGSDWATSGNAPSMLRARALYTGAFGIELKVTTALLNINRAVEGQPSIGLIGGGVAAVGLTLSLQAGLTDQNGDGELTGYAWADENGDTVGTVEGGGTLLELDANGVSELKAGRPVNLTFLHTDGLEFTTDFTVSYRQLEVLATIANGRVEGSTRDVNNISTGAYTYQWQQSETVGGAYINISGANTTTYIVSSGYDISMPFVRLEVSYVLASDNTTEAVVSSPGIRAVGVVNGGGVSFPSGGAYTGATREVDISTIEDLFGRPIGSNYLIYQWQVSDVENGTYISVGVSPTYTLSAADFKDNNARYLRVEVGSAVAGDDSYTGAVSADEDVQRPGGGNIAINTSGGFASGDSLSLNNNLTDENSRNGAAITLGDIIWESVNDGATTQVGTGETYAIDATDWATSDNAPTTLQARATATDAFGGETNVTAALLNINRAVVGQPRIALIGGGVATVGLTLSLQAGLADQNGDGTESGHTWTDSSNGNVGTAAGGGTLLVLNANGASELGAGRPINLVLTHTDGLGFTTAFTVQYRQLEVSVAIVGGRVEGEAIDINGISTGEYTYQWQQSDTVGGAYNPIIGERATSYIVPSDYDITQPFVRLEVGYVLASDDTAATVSSPGIRAVGVVNGGEVSFPSGAASPGATRTAVIGDIEDLFGRPVGSHYLNYQWQVSGEADGTYINVGVDSQTYTLSAADFNDNSARYLRVQVGSAVAGDDSYNGTVSAGEDVQRPGGGNIAINISRGVAISNTIRLDNNLTDENSRGVEIELDNIVWQSINGDTVVEIETGTVYVIDGSDWATSDNTPATLRAHATYTDAFGGVMSVTAAVININRDTSAELEVVVVNDTDVTVGATLLLSIAAPSDDNGALTNTVFFWNGNNTGDNARRQEYIVNALDVAGIEEGSLTLSVAATFTDGLGFTHILAATLARGEFGEEQAREILAVLDVGLASEIAGVIGEQLANGPLGVGIDGAPQTYLAINGVEVDEADDITRAFAARAGDSLQKDDIFRIDKFKVAYAGTDESGARWSSWAQAGWSSLSGSPTVDGEVLKYDGSNFGVYVGADKEFGDSVRAGVAVGINKTDIDMALNESDDALETNIVRDLNTILPYLQWRSANSRGSLLFLGGYGIGELELSEANGCRVSRDLDWLMGSVKGNYNIPITDGWDIGFNGGINGNQSNLEDGTCGGSASKRLGAEASTGEGSLGMETGWTSQLINGGILRPYVNVGARTTYGDLDTDAAYDVGGGLKFSMPSSGVSFSIDGKRQINDTTHNRDSINGVFSLSHGAYASSFKTTYNESGSGGKIVHRWESSRISEWGVNTINSGIYVQRNSGAKTTGSMGLHIKMEWK